MTFFGRICFFILKWLGISSVLPLDIGMHASQFIGSILFRKELRQFPSGLVVYCIWIISEERYSCVLSNKKNYYEVIIILKCFLFFYYVLHASQ